MNHFLLADAETTTYHQFARLQSLTEWWQWLLLLIVCALIVAFIAIVYRRDSVELSKPLRLTLLALRVFAFVGILIYFLGLEKRSRRELVKQSRAVVLFDTSLSMGIQDEGSGVGNSKQRRIDTVIAEMQRGDLVQSLREQHEVVLYRFDQTSVPSEIASFARLGSTRAAASREPDDATFAADLTESRTIAGVAAAIAGLGVLALIAGLFMGKRQGDGEGSWASLVGMVAVIASLVVFAFANLRHPHIDFLATLGIREAKPPVTNPDADSADEEGEAVAADPEVDWADALKPRGIETRLGDAVRYVVNRERGGPIAAIVVVTDGGNNVGIDGDATAAIARDADIPVYAVGIGGDERPANVRVVDLEAPPRVYPGDSFSMTGYIQAYGLAGRSVRVELGSVPEEKADDPNAEEEFVEERKLTLAKDGEVVPLKFDVVPAQLGRRTYRLRVLPPAEDQDKRDDKRSANVQIIDRKNRVLLFAGGPSREFRFLRNLLFRDPNSTAVVHLQTGQPGMAQEADELLYEFPTLTDELFEYDCIIAFDPDWQELDPAQIELLEEWVAEKAGGLIIVAGPVHTPRWASRLRSDERLDSVKGLYPVVFYSRGAATRSLGRFMSETPWPLEFTQDGRDAEFLWLADDLLSSEEAWTEFEGVYGYYAVKDPKPGARVYARFADPNTSIDGELPIYLAGHFYGAGRVFFQASGEMWRIRALDDGYFESYYTKLIRWASQGRLLRDSSRGVLLVDKDRCALGDHITVQAILSDAQHQPLTTNKVTASLVDPEGRRMPLELRKLEQAARAGMYSGQFTAVVAGDYKVELQPPQGTDEELLRREVKSRIPARETEQPERNDPLLKDLTDRTSGAYYVGFSAAMNRDGAGSAPLANVIEPQDQVTYLTESPDETFEEILMTWLMAFICGVLCLEWLMRRLSKLA